MQGKVLAGFDLGTTGCRCIVFDKDLSILGDSYEAYPLLTDESGKAEQDAEEWWRLLKSTLTKACACGGIDTRAISSISFSSQGITVVPVDDRLRPLANAITWLDRRGKAEADAIIEKVGDKRFREITARITPEPYGISKILWLRRHRPDLTVKTWKYLMPMDFIIARLTGCAVTDFSMAAGLACFDIKRRCWSDEVLAAAGFPSDMLAEIMPSGSVVGCILEDVASEIGLSPETLVAVGAQDQKCGALAAGIEKGIATVSMGTCLAVMMKSERLMCDERQYIPCFADLCGDSFLLEGCVNVGAGCLKWYRDMFCPDRTYEDITSQAGAYLPSIETPMFFPHLSGMSTPKRWPNGYASFYGFQLGMTRSEAIAYSVLEGVAFALRQNIEAAAETAGVRVERLRIFGGGAKSGDWMQIVADVTGLPVERLYTHEICCVGAAMLGGIGCGVFRDFRHAQGIAVRIRDVFIPRESRKALADRRYALYNHRENRFYHDAEQELSLP